MKNYQPMAWGPATKKALYFRAKNRAAGPKAPALAPRLAPLPFWRAGDRRPFGRPEAGAPTGRPEAGAPTGRPEAGAPKTAAPPEAPPALSAKTQKTGALAPIPEPDLAVGQSWRAGPSFISISRLFFRSVPKKYPRLRLG